MADEATGLVPGDAQLAPLGAAPMDKHSLIIQTLNKAQVDFLLQRTPKNEIKYRQGRGGMQFAYVEHGYVTERLNLVFGFNWDFEIVDKQILDDEVIVEARLTVRTPNGQTIVKTQFGGADIKRHASGAKSGRPLSIADDYKAAASDALKKCSSLLGIGLDLYGRDRPFEDEQEHAAVPAARVTFDIPTPEQREPAPPVSPIGAPQPGLCSKRQQREIVDLAVEAGMDIAELRRTLGVSDLAQLTEARAQRVIQRLHELTTQTQAS
jgi:hypothetical protein